MTDLSRVAQAMLDAYDSVGKDPGQGLYIDGHHRLAAALCALADQAQESCNIVGPGWISVKEILFIANELDTFEYEEMETGDAE